MIYKKYGKTGHSISAVGFGGMRFDIQQSLEANTGLIRYAVDQGVNYLDTAPGYCEDQSEDIFGLALKEMADRREDIYLSTKGMPADFNTADKAVALVEKSLERLKTDYIDFYHVWCIRGPEVEDLISNNEFEGVLLGVNILNFLYRWDGVEAAHNADLGVVAMNPLAGGIIPQNEVSLAFLAGDDETPTEAALRFCISCPQITVTLNGFTTKQHIDTACKVSDNAAPFTNEDIERIRRHVTENMDTLCTGCGYCMGRCPVNIPVSNFMQYYNEKLLMNKTDEEMIKQLDFHQNWVLLADRKSDAADCTRCGRCEMACTQHLDIVNRLEQIAKWEKTQKKTKGTSA